MTDTTTETTETTEGDEVQPGDDGRYDAEYVQKLRGEAADRRTAAKAAEDALAAAQKTARVTSERLLAAEVRDAARAILADPSDLLLNTEATELVGDDGQPDTDKIKAAAEALVAAKPHLAAKRVTGDVGQGARGATTPPAVTFGDLVRGAVGG